MTDLATLQQRLDTLLKDRAFHARRVSVQGKGETEFKSDAELASAIADIERRIAAAQGKKLPRVVNIRTVSGW